MMRDDPPPRPGRPGQVDTLDSIDSSDESVEDRESGPDPLLARAIGGRYRVERLLGEGGMGRVYLARHTTLDKAVALKVLHSTYRHDRQFTSFFHREARSASKLSHPNVVQVLDFGEESDGLLYIVMELLVGDSLASIIDAAGGPLEFTRVTRIMSQVCAALSAAHDLGMVHRDMKPENIVAVRDVDDLGAPVERIKVCDFGLAKMVDPSGSRAGATGTQVGVVKGTPHYMSPEQARGERVDIRSDVYACGIILYELVTRTLPFNADTTMGVLTRQVLDAPTPPSRLNPNVHPALEAVILKALAKDPSARQQSSRELRDELIAAMRAGASSPQPGAPRERREEPAGAAPPPVAAAAAQGAAARPQTPGTPQPAPVASGGPAAAQQALAAAAPALRSPRRVAPISHPSSGLSEFCLALTNTLVSAANAPGSPDFERTIAELAAVGAHLLPRREELTLLLRDVSQRPMLMLQTGMRAPFELKKTVNPDYFNAFASPLAEAFARRRLVSITFREQLDPAELHGVIGLLGAADVPAEQAASLLRSRVLGGIVPLFESDLLGAERSLPWDVDLRLSRLARELRALGSSGLDGATVELLRKRLVAELGSFQADGLFLVLLNLDLVGNAGADAVSNVTNSVPQPVCIRLSSLALDFVDAAAAGRPEALPRAGAARALLDASKSRLCFDRSVEGDHLLRAMHQRGLVPLSELPGELQMGVVAELRADQLAGSPERLLEAIRQAPDAAYVREVGILEHAVRVVAARGQLPAVAATLAWLSRQATSGRPGETRAGMAGRTLQALSDPELIRPIAHTLLSSSVEQEPEAARGAVLAAGAAGAQALVAVRGTATGPAARVRFVSTMRELGATAIPVLTKALVDVAKDPAADPRVVEDLLRSVPDAPSEELGAAVAPYVQTTKPGVRRAAIRALAAAWREQARADLVDALADRDDIVRSVAFAAVRQLGLVEADIVRIIDDILSETVPASDEVKTAAASALAGAEGGVRDFAMEVLDRAMAPRGRTLSQMLRLEGQQLPAPPVLDAIARSLCAVGGDLGRRLLDKRLAQLPREVRDRLARVVGAVEG